MHRSLERSWNGRSQLVQAVREIHIAREFSDTPFGRYSSDGPESGQSFRDKMLIPALKNGDIIRLVLDGVEGLPSSFWEEVMGGLVRNGLAPADLKSRMTVVANDPALQVYVRLGWKYVDDESARSIH
jgi:hypothetical protein